ncbi:hypothetical protein V5E97_14705 [Singulisphaera sp. Ch08]|uniref:Uncharacterized protein n=1 Tax=Singulisphaera sp. Ch08 TaxID=3120278 RepID=A0AAU7CPM2_9BACT
MTRARPLVLTCLSLPLFAALVAPTALFAQPDPAKAGTGLAQAAASEAGWAAMNSTTAKETLEFLVQVNELRNDLEMMRALLREGREEAQAIKDKAEAARRDPTKLVLKLADMLAARSDAFRKLVGWTDAMQAQVAELRRTAKDAEALVKEVEEIQPEDVRALKLFEEIDGRILPLIDSLRDPAQAARTLIDGQIREALSKPWAVGGLVFRIKLMDELQAVFSPEANITIVMEYLNGDLPDVEASGLYFGRDGTPKFDRLKFSTDAKAIESVLMKKGLSKLGEAIGDLGLPLTFRNLKTMGFDQPGPGGRLGGLQFDLDVNLAMGSLPLPQLKQDGIQIFSDGHVHLKGATTLKYELKPNIPIPIATTGLAFHKHAVEMSLKPEKVAISTVLSAAAPESGNAIGLDVTCRFGFPIRKIEFQGTMRTAGGLSFGRVYNGELSAEHIQGDLEFPSANDSPIMTAVTPLAVQGHFKFDKDGLIAKGKATLFNGPSIDSEIFIGTNGHGHITATADFQLFDVLKVAGELESKFTPGFKRVTANVVGMVDLDLQLFKVSAALDVDADTDRVAQGKLPIRAKASALGAEAIVDLPSFTPADFLIVVAALKRQLPDMYKNMIKALAAFEGHAAEVLAAEEAKIRQAVSDAAARAGVDAIRTGDPNVDKALGDISKGGKQIITELVDARVFGGKAATQLRRSASNELENLGRDPFGTFANTPQNALNELSNVGNLVTGAFGNKKKDAGDARRRAEEEARAKVEALKKSLDEKLGRLVSAIEGDRLDHLPKPTRQLDSRGQGVNESTRLRLLFEHAASAPWGSNAPESGEVMFLVRATGMKSTINTRYPDRSQRLSGSDVQAGYVFFQDLLKADAKPKARIGIPRLKHNSALPAELIASDEIQRLVELHVPEAEIEGYRKLYERKLAIKNETDEPMTVWVNAEARVRRDDAFNWSWDSGVPAEKAATAFLVPARSTKILGEDVTPFLPNQSVADRANDSESKEDKVAVKGRRFRLWAESETGERWEEQRSQDLWVVAKNAKIQGERAYRDDKIQTHTYVLKPKTGLRDFAERQLKLRNDTPEPLTLKLRYRSSRGGQSRWYTLPELVLAPGTTVRPRGSDGFAVRASRVVFEAEGPTRRYTAHEESPVWLVAEADGRRMYRGPKIGVYLHVFRPDTRVSR